MSTSPKGGFNFGVMRMASDIISRAQLALQAGITFDGVRDHYKVLGYKRILRCTDFRGRYLRGGLAAQVVDSYPKATWRGGAELIEDEDPEVSTEFEEAWVELDNRVKVWSALGRADILAGLGRYAVLLIGAPGDLGAPLPKTLKVGDVAYLQAFSEDDAVVQVYEEDEKNPRFGLPIFYNIKRTTNTVGGVARRGFAKKTHYSRVIHIADGVVDDPVYGTPLLERVWNYLDDLDKVSGAGAEAFWKRADRGLILNIDKDTEMSDEDATKSKEAIDEMVHNLRRTLLTRGSTVEPLGSDVANFSSPIDAVVTLIAGATGIPKRILVGSERGELASTQDRENWETRVSDRRHDFAEPVVLRPLVDLLIKTGVLPTPAYKDVDGQYLVQWPEIETLTEPERAEVADKWSKLNSQAKSIVVTASEVRDRVLRLGKLDEKDKAAEEESIKAAEPPPPVAGAPGVPKKEGTAPAAPKAPGQQPARAAEGTRLSARSQDDTRTGLPS